MSNNLTPEIRNLIISPQESSSSYVELLKAIKKSSEDGDAFSFGVPSLDRKLSPPLPGDVIGIIGRPGHGKSSFAVHIAKHNARLIQKSGKSDVIVFLTFEQSIEEMEIFVQVENTKVSTDKIKRGEFDLSVIERCALERPRLPLWLIGQSVSRRGRVAKMTVDNVYLALTSMEQEFHIHTRAVFMDYIQLVPVEKSSNRVEQVGEAIYQSKELARKLGAVLVFNVQAGRRVDNYEQPIPTAADCQWSSGIEQVADGLLAIWRPWKTHRQVQNIVIAGENLPVTSDLFVCRNEKWRLGDSGDTFVLKLDAGLVKLSDREKIFIPTSNEVLEEQPELV